MSRRFEDWPARLARFIAERENEPFAWGRNDCCLFACDGILAITGIDPASPIFRGKYDSALGGHRLLAAHGGVEAIAEKQTNAHNFAETPVALAQRGDVVLTDTGLAGPALGLCLGAHAAFPGHTALSIVPMSACRRAWRIS